ncbi:hypothetical protein B0H66DRAFT_266460 [Apodospora peruviana]|uniref:Uncharacterized protein n=1 Tax=Apodospora peruviana TaxID=516989 RepID=A0AAE0M4Q3_9PEZI|nr:hypothetical protein B0H66DRAFT_266460 [Apodospora peruviana]
MTKQSRDRSGHYTSPVASMKMVYLPHRPHRPKSADQVSAHRPLGSKGQPGLALSHGISRAGTHFFIPDLPSISNEGVVLLHCYQQMCTHHPLLPFFSGSLGAIVLLPRRCHAGGPLSRRPTNGSRFTSRRSRDSDGHGRDRLDLRCQPEGGTRSSWLKQALPPPCPGRVRDSSRDLGPSIQSSKHHPSSIPLWHRQRAVSGELRVCQIPCTTKALLTGVCITCQCV